MPRKKRRPKFTGFGGIYQNSLPTSRSQ